MCSRVSCRLKQRADDHDEDTDADGFLSSELFAEKGDSDAADEAAYFVDGDDEAGDGGAGGVEGGFEGRRVDESGAKKASQWSSLNQRLSYPPMRPLSYPIKRKPRHVNDVTAVKRSLPSRTMIEAERSGNYASR